LYIKKSYIDEPLFANSKIIFSIYNNGFPEKLNNNFSKKLMFEGIEDSDVKILKEPSYNNLTKLAVNYSDGIILGSENIDPDLMAHIQKKKVPCWSSQTPENYVDEYSKFYDTILE
jgi:starch synthase